MKYTVSSLLIASAMNLAATPSAVAQFNSTGLDSTNPVHVDLINNVARGDLRTARDDAKNNVYIGCEVSSSDDGQSAPSVFGTCQAQDNKEQDVMCTTTSATLVSAIQSMHADSNLTFYFRPYFDSFGSKTVHYECTAITVGTHSQFTD